MQEAKREAKELLFIGREIRGNISREIPIVGFQVNVISLFLSLALSFFNTIFLRFVDCSSWLGYSLPSSYY